MDFKQGSKVSLLNQLATSHGLIVGDPETWIFSPVVPLPSDDPDGKNSKIKLTAARLNPDYRDKRTFKYDRIDLAYLRSNWPAFVHKPLLDAVTTHDCFDYIRRNLGVLFDQDDLEDLPLVEVEEGSYEIQLVAKPGSIMWIGQTSIVTKDLPPIAWAINPPSFNWS